eukprot:m.336738 g.336738  ORF g.336738 m.336738 type:complete len:437 (+) comp17944_c0_seq1:129-1439(+)
MTTLLALCVSTVLTGVGAKHESCPDGRPMHTVKPEDIVPGRYVVVFQTDSFHAVDKFMQDFRTTYEAEDSQPNILHEYNINDRFRGFNADLTDEMVADLRGCAGGKLPQASKLVDYIAPDAVVRTNAPVKEEKINVFPNPESKTSGTRDSCTTQNGATWGLTRTSQRDKNLNAGYKYLSSDENSVDAYVIDTGVYLEHDEFEGRAEWGIDATTNNSPKTDENGHGTHVAGTIGGKTYGIAKNVRIIAVRVLDQYGSGTMGGVITGVQFTCEHHKENDGNKCVANMSLGGGKYSALNSAVSEAIECGCQFAVAAGNGASDACYNSPASTEDAVTVMATNQNDQSSYYSDYGKCCDLYAPGSSITSAWIGYPSAVVTISGTSMATPHVAGVMAKILSVSDMKPEELKDEILANASEDYISDVPNQDTPNLLLYNDCSS